MICGRSSGELVRLLRDAEDGKGLNPNFDNLLEDALEHDLHTDSVVWGNLGQTTMLEKIPATRRTRCE